MTSFGGKDVTEHVKNPEFWRFYLPVFPKKPIKCHPGIQLKLKHNRLMRRDGYVNLTARDVPISLLEIYGIATSQEIGDLRLDEQSIDIFKRKEWLHPL